VDEVAENTPIPAAVWETLTALRVGPESFKLGGRRVWMLETVDAWAADPDRRHEDEERGIANLLGLFREVRVELLTNGC
jgi:hypothetical protein